MKKFKIDLNFPIRNSDKVQINMAAKLVSDALSSAILKDEDKIIKYFGWADELSKHKILELDEADHKTLKDFIVNHEAIFVIAKYPILKVFSQPHAPGTGGKDKDKDKED